MTEQAIAAPMTDQIIDSVTRPVRWFMTAIIVVSVILIAQAWTYTGLMFALAEWQFDRLGRYFPTLTIIILLALVAVLWMALSWARRRLARGSRAREVAATPPELRALARLGFARRFFKVFTAAAALGAIITLVHYFQMPAPTRNVAVIDLASGRSAVMREGSTQLRGVTPLGPIARWSEDLIFDRSSIYLVPVGRTRMENGTEAANLFMQVESNDTRRVPTQLTGLLRRSALPNEIAVLYRGIDVAVAPDSAVLFFDQRSAARSTVTMGLTLLVLTMFGGLFFLYTRRRERQAREALGLMPAH